MKRSLFLPLLALPIAVFAEGGLPDRPYIYVQGKAEIEKPADMVTLHFAVVTRGPDQPKANDEVQAKAKKIFALLNTNKIAQQDIVAESLKSEPEFEQEENGSRSRGKLIGYSVTRPFDVKVRDVTAFPKLVDEIIAVGGVEFYGIDGGLVKEKEMQDQIWEKALASARERAEKTLKPLGLKIDSIFAVSPLAFPEIQRDLFGENQRVIVTGAAAPMEMPSQYRLAPVTISQSVHVIYLISPAK